MSSAELRKRATTPKPPLIQLKDGAVLAFEDAAWIEETGYCDSCFDERAWTELTVKTTSGTLVYEKASGGKALVYVMGNLTRLPALTLEQFAEELADAVGSRPRVR